MKRILTIVIGIIGVLVGLGFICPAIAQVRMTGSMQGFEVALLLLGIVLTLGGGGAAFYGVRKRPA